MLSELLSGGWAAIAEYNSEYERLYMYVKLPSVSIPIINCKAERTLEKNLYITVNCNEGISTQHESTGTICKLVHQTQFSAAHERNAVSGVENETMS